MGKFKWEGTTKSGQSMKGEMEAPNEQAVQAQLRRQGISPGNIKEAGKGFDMEIKIPGLNLRLLPRILLFSPVSLLP